jgi:hypothetical protein
MTRRQEIIKILSKEEKTAQELANLFKIELKFILEDLEHIRRTVKPRKLVMKPAFCKSCGFVFKERSKISKPSRCPRCKKEWIQAALFKIE